MKKTFNDMNELNEALCNMFAQVVVSSVLADMAKDGENVDEFIRKNEQKIANLKAKFDERTGDVESVGKVKTLTDTLIQRDAEIKELNETIVSLQATLAEREAEIDRQNDMVSLMDETVRKLNHEIEEKNYTLMALEELEDHADNVAEENEMLRDKVADLRRKVEDMELQIRQHRHTIRKMSDKEVKPVWERINRKLANDKFTCKAKDE